MHPQHSVPGSAPYLNNPQVPTNNHLAQQLRSATISRDEDTNHQFQIDETKGKLGSIKIGQKRAGQPPEIFVFDFTNVNNGGDRTEQPSLKQACMTNGNGNVNNIDIPVTLNTLTHKSPLNPSGSSSPSLNPPNMIQPQQQAVENIVPINNGNQQGGQILSLTQSTLPDSRNSSPNCQPSQTMLWC